MRAKFFSHCICFSIQLSVELRIQLSVEEFWQNAGHTAGSVLADQLSKRFFRVIALEKFGYFNGFGWLIQSSAGGGHLNSPHHVAADDREKGHRICSNMRPKLLLKHLKQISFR